MIALVSRSLDGTDCGRCGKRPDLMWAWDGVDKVTIIQSPDLAAQSFAAQTVPHLKAKGWGIIGGQIYCPDCLGRQDRNSHGSATA